MTSLSLTGFTGPQALKRSLCAEFLQFAPEMLLQIDHGWNVAAGRWQSIHGFQSRFEGGASFVGPVGLDQNFAFARQPGFFARRFGRDGFQSSDSSVVIFLLKFNID